MNTLTIVVPFSLMFFAFDRLFNTHEQRMKLLHSVGWLYEPSSVIRAFDQISFHRHLWMLVRFADALPAYEKAGLRRVNTGNVIAFPNDGSAA